jgi:hypothetical protein
MLRKLTPAEKERKRERQFLLGSGTNEVKVRDQNFFCFSENHNIFRNLTNM